MINSSIALAFASLVMNPATLFLSLFCAVTILFRASLLSSKLSLKRPLYFLSTSSVAFLISFPLRVELEYFLRRSVQRNEFLCHHVSFRFRLQFIHCKVSNTGISPHRVFDKLYSQRGKRHAVYRKQSVHNIFCKL